MNVWSWSLHFQHLMSHFLQRHQIGNLVLDSGPAGGIGKVDQRWYQTPSVYYNLALKLLLITVQKANCLSMCFILNKV